MVTLERMNGLPESYCFHPSFPRYEVFIIGPSGKRFRSRNELKVFFEKTGEKGLDPEDFDFSTFGTGRGAEKVQYRKIMHQLRKNY